MKNGDEALPSIIWACRGILVKMLITLECTIYFNQILHTYTLSRLWYAQQSQGFADDKSGRSLSDAY